MSSRALTAKYRPQTFADVAGQDTVKHILSRASLEGKVAPAYLFSGTRGVGKTTIARIFAKALNCRTAPAAEPCNTCDMCKSITLGTAVDVVEIDGASNRGIDDVRRLKEVIGYAPMDGRYKIFIIDEAHMLSREAFNALLKTLEEPPARVTFVMATTEAHKFPATIVSRCQHFVFKPLAESALAEHLEKILKREQLQFDEGAVHLIARRGAGSVRDSMSLLGQVLAMQPDYLNEANTRNVLGLAGQEAFANLLEAFKNGNTLDVSLTLHNMLDLGLDIGFFLRELVSTWRNLFILKQSGRAALPVVPLPIKEAEVLLQMAEGFSTSHIHACWQMTTEGQRRVLTSLEPALALELLLLNITLLPQLLSLEKLSALGRAGGSGNPQGQGTPPKIPSASGQQFSGATAQAQALEKVESTPKDTTKDISYNTTATNLNQIIDEGSPSEGSTRQKFIADKEQNISAKTFDSGNEQIMNAETPASGNKIVELTTCSGKNFEENAASYKEQPAHKHDIALPMQDGHASEQIPFDADSPEYMAGVELEMESGFEHSYFTAPVQVLPSWKEILDELQKHDESVWLLELLRKVEAYWDKNKLILRAIDGFVGHQLKEHTAKKMLDDTLIKLCGVLPIIDIKIPNTPKQSTENALKEEIMVNPVVQSIMQEFDAQLINYGQLYQ